MANYGHLFYPEGEIVYSISNWSGDDEKVVYWKVLEYNSFKTSIDYIVEWLDGAELVSLDRQIAIIKWNDKRFEIFKYFGHLARFVIRMC